MALKTFCERRSLSHRILGSITLAAHFFYFKKINLVMKNIFFIFLAITSISLTSCSKDDEVGSNGNCALSAKIDGSDWCGSANFSVTNLGPAGVITSIGAGNADMEAIGLQFMSDQTGTYDLGGSLASWTINSVPYLSTSGTLTISKFEGDKISGTFNFEGQSTDGTTVSVTGGKFDNLEKQ